MDDLLRQFSRLCGEAGAATAYFHIWLTIASTDNPAPRQYRADIGPLSDFVDAVKAGFLSLTFVTLAKVYDRHPKVFGIKALREGLAQAGLDDVANRVASIVDPHRNVVCCVCGIRNKLVAHNQANMTPDEVTASYGVSPDELRDLIEATREALREVARALGTDAGIPEFARFDAAATAVLDRLQGAHPVGFPS